MAQVFVKKVWGADLEAWPLLAFPTRGFLRSFLDRADDNALVCLVATKNKHPAEADRGRILGLVQCSRAEVDAENVVLRIAGGKKDPESYEHGQFKWPYGLALKNAWHLPEKPLASEVVGKLHLSSVRGCEKLSPAAASAVLKLRRKRVALPDIGLFSPDSGVPRRSVSKSATKPTQGIPPTVAGYKVTRGKAPATLYVLHFQDLDIFKIGWAFDAEERTKDINCHIPSEFLKRKWELCLWHRFEDQYKAFKAEQQLLRGALSKFRTVGERVKIPEKTLREIWKKR